MVTAVAALMAGVMGASADAASAASGPTITLNLFTCSSDCVPQPWQITDFQKLHPNIKISVSQVPFGQFYAKTSVLAGSNNPPDVYTVDQPTISNLAAAKVIIPLTKYFPASYVKSLTPAARSELMYQGKLYSPGPVDTTEGLFYNATMLNKLGIHPPTNVSNAWTWPQALAAMEKCQTAASTSSTKVWGLAPTTFGNGTPGSDYQTLLFLRSEGNPKAPKGSSAYNTYWGISSNGSTVDGYLNTPQAIAGATFYRGLFQTAKVSPTTGIPNSFIDQQACFELQTSQYIDTLNSAKLPFKFGVTPLPYFKTPVDHTGTLEVAVGSKTKHLAQAVEFVKFLASPSQQEQMVKRYGYMPVLSSLYKSMKFLQTPQWTMFSQELERYGEPRPVTPHYLQFSDLFTNTMRDIAYGSSPSSELNQVTSQLDQVLSTPPGAL
jgi:fructooligosaccharide transport system substrate-binding protein